jgi:hypothetical protein
MLSIVYEARTADLLGELCRAGLDVGRAQALSEDSREGFDDCEGNEQRKHFPIDFTPCL